MQPLDVKVVEQVLAWLNNSQPVWFCTVLSTWGSSPREPGSLFAACSASEWVGSLSGGCVEDEFLAQLGSPESLQPVAIQRYGDGQSNGEIKLPCGGILTVCVEYIQPTKTWVNHFEGYSIVSTAMYWKKCWVKLEIHLAKGKQSHDKRDTIKDRDWDRQKARVMKHKA